MCMLLGFALEEKSTQNILIKTLNGNQNVYFLIPCFYQAYQIEPMQKQRLSQMVQADIQALRKQILRHTEFPLIEH